MRARGVVTPILALTGHDHDAFLAEALELGFDGVLSKSCSRTDLIEACARQIVGGERRSRRA